MIPIDTYYRGYRLSSTEGETSVFYEDRLIETITLEGKGRHRTTTDAAKDDIDAWHDAG